MHKVLKVIIVALILWSTNASANVHLDKNEIAKKLGGVFMAEIGAFLVSVAASRNAEDVGVGIYAMVPVFGMTAQPSNSQVYNYTFLISTIILGRYIQTLDDGNLSKDTIFNRTFIGVNTWLGITILSEKLTNRKTTRYSIIPDVSKNSVSFSIQMNF